MAYNSYLSDEDFSKKEFNENNEYKIHKNILKKLLSIQAPSRQEAPVQKYILSFINANKVKCSIETDKLGNILITKGQSEHFPCLVSHMDEVNAIQSDRTIIELNNHFIGINANTGCPAGTSGDDLVGVYICLEGLMNYDNIKVAFFVSEEIGCVGSAGIDMEFFKDVAFIFQADRKGDNEVIYNTNGVDVMDQNFKDFIKPEMDLYNYKFSTGTSTDVGKLMTRGAGVVGFNIGCGYFEPHTLKEKVCISSVENCMNLIFRIMNNCISENKRFDFVPEKKKVVTYPSYGRGNYWEDDYEYGYNRKTYETKQEKIDRYKKRTLTKDEEAALDIFNKPEYWKSFEYNKKN